MSGTSVAGFGQVFISRESPYSDHWTCANDAASSDAGDFVSDGGKLWI
jgi:hypothetical protein